MSNFVSLNTALSGLRAAQTGLDTAAHNVANANTPGYTRQRIDLRSSLHYPSPVGPMGTGVDVAGISRSRDAFLDARARTLSAGAARDATSASLLERAESVLGEPDGGVSRELGALWDAFEDLASDPSESATRQQALTVLGALAARVRGVATGFAQLGADTTARLANRVDDANVALQRVADLNRRIADVSLRDGTPNDLLDQRDGALDDIAALLGAEIRITGGQAQVLVGGVAVVDGYDAAALTYAGGELRIDGAPATVGGELGSLQRFLDETLPAQHAELDAFAADLAAALNDRHAQGYDPQGNPGGPLLDYDAAAGAAGLQLAAGLTASSLAAASDPAAEVHDGRNAAALAALRNDRVAGATLDATYATFVVRLGGSVAAARAAADTSASLAGSADVARMSMHGVSIDEEMASLVQYQRSLEATSRVMTAIDQALDVLINRTGVVGR